MNEQLIQKLALIGFRYKESRQLLENLGLLKPWIVFEEIGISVINPYSVSRIEIL